MNAKTGPGIKITLLAVLVSAAALPASARANGTVDAGSLQVSAQSSPWQMSFSQVGGPTLTEAPGTGAGPNGTLGFRTLLGWYHATGVVPGSEATAANTYTATLDTNDPSGRRLRVTIEPDLEGVARVSAQIVGGSTLDVSAIGIGFDAVGAERYLGFGERSNAVNQRGNEVENYVSDGPYQPEERPFFNAFVPPDGYHPRDDATYFPMPWLLSSAGYGVLIENTEISYFRLATENASQWSLEVEATKLAFRVFAGPDPADVVRRLTKFTGRQPKTAAAWMLGPWYQPANAGAFEQAQMLRDEDVPASTANTFLHYLPCGDQQGKTDQAREQSKAFHDLGYAVTTYFNPMVCNDYQPVFDEAVAADVLTKRSNGDPYVYRYTSGVGPDREFMVGQFDFTAAGADAFYGNLLDEAVGDGFDGWMEDFGEYTPLDSQSANGMGGDQMHNLYPALYHRSSYRYAETQDRPVAGYIRSGWTGVHSYAQLVWGGDPTQDWGYDGLESAMYQGLNMGMSGISRWGSAVGGFFALGQRNRTPELLKRWIQFGAVSGIMRTEKDGVSLPPKTRPQVFDPEILPLWRRYTKLRTQLYPYIQAADATYKRTGLPVMRHMTLSYPDDPMAASRNDQFMFGPDLLAAPVVQEGETKRDLYLPAGDWINLIEALTYKEEKGNFRLGAAKLLAGGGPAKIDAPLEELPLLARAGALITMLPPTVDTLAEYGDKTNGVVKLSDRERRRRILALPRGSSGAPFGLHGKLVSKDRSKTKAREWRLKVKGERAKVRYNLQASLATLKRPIEPCKLRYGGRTVPDRRWSYSANTGVIRATLRAKPRKNVLRVIGC